MLTHQGQHCSHNSLIPRCQASWKMFAKYGATDDNGKEFANIDKVFRDSLLAVERAGSVGYLSPWSKKLQQSVNVCKYWKAASMQLRYGIDCSKLINDLGICEGLPTKITVDKRVALQNLRIAQWALRDDRANGTTLRVAMLQEDRRSAIDEGDKERAAMLNRIIRAEALHSSFLKLQRALNKRSSASIDTVQIQQLDGSVTSTSKATEMVPLIIDHNRAHFGQAEGTPFTVGSLRTIEHTACCHRANSILAGTFVADDISEMHSNFIDHLAITSDSASAPYVDCALSVDDVKAGYAAWKESTSTSPYGDHLGIYKVLLKKMDNIAVSDSTASDIQQDAWTITTCIINMGATFGLTLPRWEETVCVMIEKSPGNLLLHKLRRIFIMASDYNLTLGTIVGRRLLWRAEDLGMLHKDLWGTRKDRSANDAALMKELTFGLARVTGTALATFDNDAKSCYDRVVMTLALIICRKLGLPSKAAAWIGNTTKQMRNFIKTGHGISDAWFGNNDGSGTVKHGIGQGHRAAPAIWLFVSNFLFHILEKSATGASFFDPSEKRQHHRAADGYVDDVTGFTNLFHEEMMGPDSYSV